MSGAVSFRRMGPLDLLAPEPDPLLGGPPPRNAYVELHNPIAAAERPSEFGPADRDRISERWGVDLASSFLAERIALYQAVLDDRLADGDLDGDDRDVVAHVAHTLGLSAADLRPAHERAFGVAVEAAVADNALSDSERGLLYTLQHTLGFDPDVAGGAYDVFARRRLLTVVARALADGEVTPAEADEIDRACEALSVTVPEDLARRLADAAARWQARNGALPEVRVGIALEPGEVGHVWSTGATWQTVDGVRLRAASDDHRAALLSGRAAGLRVPDTALEGAAEAGEVVLTSRRLLLRPAQGEPTGVPLGRLADALGFENGVVVRTTGNRRTVLRLAGDAGAFHTLLLRLLRPPPEPTEAPPPPRPAPTGEVSFRASGVKWRAVDEGLVASSERLRTAIGKGATTRLRLGGAPLADVPTAGEVVVSDRALTLTGMGRTETFPLAAMRPPRRFINGLLVRAEQRAVLIDAGGRTDALYTTLRRALAGPD